MVTTVVATVFGLSAGTASAHNTLLASDPADGATLQSAPAQITWLFDRSVPLETMTVTMIDVGGIRSELDGSFHGPDGDSHVTTPLPALQPGVVSVRWRLVGPDGHPITGRVEFTFADASAITTPAPTSTVFATAATVPSSTTAPAPIGPVEAESAAEADDGVYNTSPVIRWVVRFASYLSIMATVGILLTGVFVWPGAGTNPLLRNLLARSLVTTAILGVVQLLVVASDVSGKAPWSSFGSIDAAITTDAGMAFMIRVVLAVAMWIVLFQYRIMDRDVYWTAVSLPGLGLLATWAFAGHSRSMRWPALGVATDVAHHAAAAAWIAGLAIVGWIVIPRTKPDIMVSALRNFSRLAAVSVGVLVATGVVQSARLVGNPVDLLDARHGRYLVAKVLLLVVMLAIANANRRRIVRHTSDSSNPENVASLQRAIVAEFAIGLVIIGVTAAMVVSPPATSQMETGAPSVAAGPLYYTM